MSAKYVHYFNNEAFDQIVALEGLSIASGKASEKSKPAVTIKPKVCPNCMSANPFRKNLKGQRGLRRREDEQEEAHHSLS